MTTRGDAFHEDSPGRIDIIAINAMAYPRTHEPGGDQIESLLTIARILNLQEE